MERDRSFVKTHTGGEDEDKNRHPRIVPHGIDAQCRCHKRLRATGSSRQRSRKNDVFGKCWAQHDKSQSAEHKYLSKRMSPGTVRWARSPFEM